MHALERLVIVSTEHLEHHGHHRSAVLPSAGYFRIRPLCIVVVNPQTCIVREGDYVLRHPLFSMISASLGDQCSDTRGMPDVDLQPVIFHCNDDVQSRTRRSMRERREDQTLLVSCAPAFVTEEKSIARLARGAVTSRNGRRGREVRVGKVNQRFVAFYTLRCRHC